MDDEIVDSGHMKKGGLLDRLVAGVADAADAGAKAVNAGAEAIKAGEKKDPPGIRGRIRRGIRGKPRRRGRLVYHAGPRARRARVQRD